MEKSKRRIDLDTLPPDQAVSIMRQLSKMIGEKFATTHSELSEIVNTYGFDLHLIPEITPNDKIEFMIAFALTKEGVTFDSMDDLTPGNVATQPAKSPKWKKITGLFSSKK